MISPQDLKMIARARLKDAEALFNCRRYDGALYLCGYVVEIGLKARICRTLKWPGFPETSQEFSGLAGLKTHKLDVLLKFSGKEPSIKSMHLAQWSVVASWEPEVRYKPVGTASKADAKDMIECSRTLLKALS